MQSAFELVGAPPLKHSHHVKIHIFFCQNVLTGVNLFPLSNSTLVRIFCLFAFCKKLLRRSSQFRLSNTWSLDVCLCLSFINFAVGSI